MNKFFALIFLVGCGVQGEDSSFDGYNCQWQCNYSCNEAFSGYRDHPAYENPVVLEACLASCDNAPDKSLHALECKAYVSNTIQYYQQENQ